MEIKEFLRLALEEDVGPGDYSTLASIPAEQKGSAILKVKENGILSGASTAIELLDAYGDPYEIESHIEDGSPIRVGDIVFSLSTHVHTILKLERLILNLMQRMCGIATLTHNYAELVKDYPVKILDTRKTTPLLRQFEKKAVRDGGGTNHRFGLYDMVMLKDNHIDYCGGITEAVNKTKVYLREHNIDIPIEVETRNLEEVKEALSVGGVDRIMLDNFEPNDIREALKIVDGQCETEASGGIEAHNLLDYAATGVDFISIGALTHHAVNLDLSLKAQIH